MSNLMAYVSTEISMFAALEAIEQLAKKYPDERLSVSFAERLEAAATLIRTRLGPSYLEPPICDCGHRMRYDSNTSSWYCAGVSAPHGLLSIPIGREKP